MSLLDQASLILTPNAYKVNKVYSIIPSSGSGDMTTTRATSATRVNSSGVIENIASGVPRLDYSNSLTAPSWLLEPQRTNLAAYSSEFDNAYWTKNNSTISANLVTSPDGTTTADKIVSNLFTGRIGVSKIFTVTANVKNTFTIYAKAAEWSRICIFHDATTFSEGGFYGGNTVVNLLTGVSSNPSITKSTSVGNGWYRIETSATPTITSHHIAIIPFAPSTTDVNAVVGDGVSGVYIWGGQMETGSYATSYIPTTTSTVTRNQDLASVSGISSLIGQTEGVMFIESAALANDLTHRVLSISDGTANNRIFIRYEVTSNTISAFGVVGGVSFANQIIYALSDETQYAKIALRYKVNDITLWVNGAKRGVDTTSQILPSSLSRLAFDRGDSTDIFYGKVKSAQLYKTYLTDAEMASLTTL